ncbi:hypothetical protein [Streptomyces luteolus]|uniref:Uncharacterized protein n=1 Tax=Streptomyces luteolus TaxID=3043615 RepID=A0ABT6T663_9ACTN|nr:hypothetical protein [Streptomyces sp. B-S-A12]MDI3423356.1 hypothetical protein [Streptomyces sp. B-S-A12]
MSTWRRVTSPRGESAVAGNLVWFADDPEAAETWAYGYPAEGAAARAARAWAATAHAAASALGGATAEVVGDGALARLVRLATSGPAQDTGPGPDVVVETTGTAAGIREALASVPPGGRVLLAARPLDTTTALATYDAVHLPGIHVVPVSWDDGGEGVPGQLVAHARRDVWPMPKE